MISTISTGTLGFPRIGPRRELKFALEKYWQSSDATKDGQLNELLQVAKDIEEKSWTIQASVGIDRITVGDYYLYDGILQWTEMLGIIPMRFLSLNVQPGYARLFAMARGLNDAPALSKFRCFTHSLLSIIIFNKLRPILRSRNVARDSIIKV
jgi:5-methyltetrahydropteroyltriglutamate--homocysteine methyltransferase